jgi:hypothetical protein
MKCLDDFSIWRRGLELAEEVQKMIDDLPAWDSDDSLGSLHKTTLSVPAYLAEGFIMGNSRDTKRFLWGAQFALGASEWPYAYRAALAPMRGSHPQDKSDISELN